LIAALQTLQALLISPLLNSGYQYLKPALGMHGDISALLQEFPQGYVHVYMSAAILLYLAGLWYIFSRPRQDKTAFENNDHRVNSS